MRGKKSHWGPPLSWSYSQHTQREKLNHNLRELHSPLGPATSSLKWLNVEPRRLKGNPSFSRDIEALGSISGLKVSYLGTQHSLAWVLSLKIKLSVIPSPLTELSFGMESTDLTQAKAEPQQIQPPKVTGKGLSSVSAK